MRKYLFSDSALKIVSIIVAVVLWMYVMSEQNPHVTYVIKDVPVKLLNLDEDRFALKGDSKFFVNVRINGRRSIVTEVKPQDITAEANLQGRIEGENLVPVTVSVPSNVEMVDFYPKEIMVNLDAIVEDQLPITVELKGKPKEGFAVKDPDVKPEAVFIKGPRSKVDIVKKVVATIDVSGKDSNIASTVPLKALDSKGNVQKGIDIWPKTVEVSLPIVPVNSIPIVPNIIGNPPEGYSIKSVKLEKTKMPITGDSSVLGNISNITTEPINVEGVTRSFEREVRLILPQGIQPVSDRNTVKISIEIEKMITKKVTLSLNDLIIDNLPQDAKIDTEVSNIVLTILGPESTIEEVDSKMIKLYGNIDGISEGEHQIKLNATIDKPYTITNIEPDTIKVIIY